MKIQEILEYIYLENPLHQRRLVENFSSEPGMKEDLNRFLEKYRPYMKNRQIQGKDLADSYLLMVDQMSCARLEFIRTGKYLVDNQSDALKEVYGDERLMIKYMLGLALSQFLWKHHYKLFSFYRNEIAKLNNPLQCLEVGSGHGLFLLELLSTLPKIQNLDVIDISKTSLVLSEQLIQTLDPTATEKTRFTHVSIEDFHPSKKYDFITMGEVLEHVADPGKILRSLKSMLAENGRVYISTCVNCPTIDHIYLFNNMEEIRDLIQGSGFVIQSEVIAPSDSGSPEKIVKFKLDISYGAILALV